MATTHALQQVALAEGTLRDGIPSPTIKYWRELVGVATEQPLARRDLIELRQNRDVNLIALVHPNDSR
jgi:hypothetical protein